MFKASDEQTPPFHCISLCKQEGMREEERRTCCAPKHSTADSSSPRLQPFTLSETQPSCRCLSLKRLLRAMCKHLTMLSPVNTEHCYFCGGSAAHLSWGGGGCHYWHSILQHLSNLGWSLAAVIKVSPTQTEGRTTGSCNRLFELDTFKPKCILYLNSIFPS